MASNRPSESERGGNPDDNVQKSGWEAHAAQFAQLSHPNLGQWPQNVPAQLPVMTWDGFNVVEPHNVEHYLASPVHADLSSASYFEAQYFPGQDHAGMSIVTPNVKQHREEQHIPVPSGTLSSQAKFEPAERANVHRTSKELPPHSHSLSKGPPKSRKGKTPVSQASSSSKEASAETTSRTTRLDATTESTVPSEGEVMTLSLKKEDDSPGPSQAGDAKESLLERNRVAASKFRNRKRDETKDLVADEKNLEQIHAQLSQWRSELKTEVLRLKSLLLEHAHCDCVMIREYIRREAERILKGAGQEGNGASDEWPIDIHNPHTRAGFPDFA